MVLCLGDSQSITSACAWLPHSYGEGGNGGQRREKQLHPKMLSFGGVRPLCMHPHSRTSGTHTEGALAKGPTVPHGVAPHEDGGNPSPSSTDLTPAETGLSQGRTPSSFSSDTSAGLSPSCLAQVFPDAWHSHLSFPTAWHQQSNAPEQGHKCCITFQSLRHLSLFLSP